MLVSTPAPIGAAVQGPDGDAVARRAGDRGGRRLGQRGIGERRAHSSTGQNRRQISGQPELALQLFAGGFDLGDQIMAIAILALLEPPEIARQIYLEHGSADFA